MVVTDDISNTYDDNEEKVEKTFKTASFLFDTNTIIIIFKHYVYIRKLKILFKTQKF